MLKFKKGDEILVTAGKDRGKKGKIEKIYPKDAKALVGGINMFKRHMKKRDEQHPGGIIDFARPLPFAKIALICKKCGKSTRVGWRVEKNEKFRVCKKCASTT